MGVFSYNICPIGRIGTFSRSNTVLIVNVVIFARTLSLITNLVDKPNLLRRIGIAGSTTTKEWDTSLWPSVVGSSFFIKIR